MNIQNESENHLAPLVAAAPKAVELLSKIKPIGKFLKGAKKWVGSIAGGVKQDRFLDRRDKVLDLFKAAGYSNSLEGKTFATKFKVLAADVPDKLTSRSYSKEFDRLHAMVIARLNANNPGLGDAFNSYVPEFKMVNKGNISGKNIDALAETLKTFPPNTYKCRGFIAI